MFKLGNSEFIKGSIDSIWHSTNVQERLGQSKPGWVVVSLQSCLPQPLHASYVEVMMVPAVRTYPFQLIPHPVLPLPASSPPFSDQAQWMFHKGKDHRGFIVGFHWVTVKTQFTLPLDLWTWSSHSRRRQWHPTPVLLPRKSHGRRSLVGCSPWGR